MPGSAVCGSGWCAPRWNGRPTPLGREVYLGAEGVVRALADGADVVITGRVADAALFLAPLVFEHGWSWDDWDRLAAGILVGHLLECSGQVAGGNYSGDWWTRSPHPWDLPYPIAEVDADGTAVITKPAGTGGRVSLRHRPAPTALRGARSVGVRHARRRRRLHHRGAGGDRARPRARVGRSRTTSSGEA